MYTNLFDADPDVPTHDEIRRATHTQRWSSMYKHQWWYMPLAYGLLTLKVRLDDILYVWWTKTDGPVRVNYFDSPLVRIVLSKGFWLCYRVILPLTLFNVHWATFLSYFLISELAGGYWLACNFQVSHISRDAVFPTDLAKDADGNIPLTWAETQVVSGVDYAHGNPLVTFFAGALNYQITHHLFPCISQYHYPAITPILMKVAQKRGIPWRVESNFLQAWRNHVAHLVDLGEKEIAHPLQLE